MIVLLLLLTFLIHCIATTNNYNNNNNNNNNISKYRILHSYSEDDKKKKLFDYNNIIKDNRYDSILSSSDNKHLLKKENESWIKKFCLKNDFYIEVPLSFVEDPMTYNSIYNKFDSPYTEEAMKLISSTTFNDYNNNNNNNNNNNKLPDETIKKIDKVAQNLYNLLHVRYIETIEGLKTMKQRYESGIYGQCPRIYCRGHNLLPIGLHDRPGRSSVKCYCPKCQELYQPNSFRHRRMDGVAFGTSLPHLLLQRFPELYSEISKDKYIPKIYGFRIDKDNSDDDNNNNNNNETEDIHDNDNSYSISSSGDY